MSCLARSTSRTSPRGASFSVSLRCLSSVFVLSFLSSSYVVLAAPSAEHEERRSMMERRDNGGSSAQIYGPIIGVVGFLFVCILLLYLRRRGVFKSLPPLRNFLGPINPTTGASSTALNSGSSRNGGGVTELTAEGLAGPQAVAQHRQGQGNRTARRTRRTPSQISTKSLPVYMKEPGEHELVIIQGSQDMEDAPVEATTVVMPSVGEEEAESDSTEHQHHSRNNSQTSIYVAVPQSNANTPLLSAGESNDNNQNHAHARTGSVDVTDPEARRISLNPNTQGDDSRSALLRQGSDLSSAVPSVINTNMNPNTTSENANNETDPRGEAPPYFEVITDANGTTVSRRASERARAQSSPAAPSSMQPDEDEVTARNTSANRRLSGFRGILSALNPAHHRTQSQAARDPEANTSHMRQHSGPSIVSLNSDDSLPAARSSPDIPRLSNVSLTQRPGSSAANRSNGNTHRPSLSGGSAFSNLSNSALRTMSRTRTRSNSNFQNLNNPSTISINSISSPLTHTLVRTDFVYPRTGPTPEQLRLLSSRESVGKFGVPYGRDAVMYAASNSRVDLSIPPPEFEEREGGASIDGLPASGGPSRLHARGPSGVTEESARGESPASSLEAAPTTETSDESRERRASMHSRRSSHPTTEEQEPPLVDVATVADAGAETRTLNESQKSVAETARPSSPAPPLPAISTTSATAPSSSAPSPSTSTPTATSAPFHHKPTALNISATTSNNAPPTAFRMPTSSTGVTPGSRSESRASGYSTATYATAEEGSFPPDTPGTVGGGFDFGGLEHGRIPSDVNEEGDMTMSGVEGVASGRSTPTRREARDTLRPEDFAVGVVA